MTRASAGLPGSGSGLGSGSGAKAAGAWNAGDIRDLTGCTALVTDVSNGMGRTVATVLAENGAVVVVGAPRRPSLAEAADRLRADVPAGTFTPVLLDLADMASIRRTAALVGAAGPLHLLVHTAGVRATTYRPTFDGFELELATHHIGPFALTGLLFPALAAAATDGGDVRVVSVASPSHRLARKPPLHDPRVPPGRYRLWANRAETGLASLLFTYELDRRARACGVPVKAMAAHPGSATIDPVRARSSSRYGRDVNAVLDGALTVLRQSPEEGAMSLLMAATASLPSPSYVGPGGAGHLRGAPRPMRSSPLARDPEAARKLWKVTQDVTGVAFPKLPPFV